MLCLQGAASSQYFKLEVKKHKFLGQNFKFCKDFALAKDLTSYSL